MNGREKRRYKKKDDLRDVERWCMLYPWYRNLVDDIRHTLDVRAKKDVVYHVNLR